MDKKPKLKNRCIFLIQNTEPNKFYMGSSASAMAERIGLHKMTISRGALLAEQNGGIYTNKHFTIYVTADFVKGKKRNGFFSYQR